MTNTSDILSAVNDQFGIRFTEVHTGGGCMALEARLESGHWIVATDEYLNSLTARIAMESERNHDGETHPCGWMIGIYPNSTEFGEDWWGGGQDTIVDVTDYDAYASGLAELVGRAIAALASA